MYVVLATTKDRGRQIGTWHGYVVNHPDLTLLPVQRAPPVLFCARPRIHSVTAANTMAAGMSPAPLVPPPAPEVQNDMVAEAMKLEMKQGQVRFENRPLRLRRGKKRA